MEWWRDLRDLIDTDLKFQLHSFEGGGGLNGPGPRVIGYLHHGGGNRGRLAEQEVHVQSLEIKV